MKGVPDETIVALSSAPGGAARGVVRCTGPESRRIVESLFSRPLVARRLVVGTLQLPPLPPVPATALLFVRPHSVTGQELVEIHTLASPPIIDVLLTALTNAGARPARAGEFTLRSFLAGKCDLPRAEAVMAVIESRSDDELRSALTQLAGGVTRPLDGLRDDLLDLLADIEAELDFSEEDITFVERPDILARLAKGMAQLTILQRQLANRAVAGRPFRVALVGDPNAGKSSLFNALTGGDALVSATPGTTRDYLVRPLKCNETTVELIDTAGWDTSPTAEEQAQRLGRDEATHADLLLWCVPVNTLPCLPPDLPTPHLAVATKCDLAMPPCGFIATSALDQRGFDALKIAIVERASIAPNSLALSGTRCRQHVEAALTHLRAAHAIVLFGNPAELLALELRLALDQVGELVGAVYTDDLLDRIFSRFCIGK